jgi:hypothetical protein
MCEIITSNFKAVDVFVDAAGKHWAIPDILWASRLVSIFHASQPDCLGQSLRPSRTLPETGSSGYSERVMGYSDTLGLWKSSRGNWLIIELMLSWDALHPFRFKPAGMVTTAFLGIAKTDLRTAAQYVCGLPYGRNSDPSDPVIVLAKQRGTCSTKHALLRRLAIEQGLDIALVLGIYEMTERNTPGVGPVLRRHGLSSLLEAHCYLRTGGKRIDVTKASSERGVERIERFLYEEEMDPKQITLQDRRAQEIPHEIPHEMDG